MNCILSLYSDYGFKANAQYVGVSKKRNPFCHNIKEQEIDLLTFSGVSNLSSDFISELTQIGRLSCFAGNDILLSSVRYDKAKHIDCRNGKVVVCLRRQGRMPFYTDSIPNLTFLVCDSVTIGSKSGDNCLNLGGDDTCFTFHNFKLLDFPSEPIDEHQNQIVQKLYGENAEIKNNDLLLDCYDAHGGCILSRIEPYSFTFGDGRGNSGQTLPKVTSVFIEEGNTLVLSDGSSDWTMEYGVRLLHSRTRDIYEWRRTFSSSYSMYHYLMELDMGTYGDDKVWKDVWVWGGQTKTVTKSEVIDNR